MSEFPERLADIAKRVSVRPDGQKLALEIVELANELEDRLEDFAKMAARLLEELETARLAVRLAPARTERDASAPASPPPPGAAARG